MVDIDKIFKYPKGDSASEEKILTPLSFRNVFYVKHMDPTRFEHPISFNFARQINRRSQEANLVVQPKTFNISQRFGDNKYVLCTFYDQFSIYVLRFPSETEADEFSDFVQDHVNRDIPCTNDWLTPEMLRQIDLPEIQIFPRWPYLEYSRNKRDV